MIGKARSVELSLMGERLPRKRRWNGASSTASMTMLT